MKTGTRCVPNFQLVHDTNIDFNLVDEWADIKRQADNFSQQDVFEGISGFEWSHPLLGHVCVYGTENYITFLITGDLLDRNMFYRWLSVESCPIRPGNTS